MTFQLSEKQALTYFSFSKNVELFPSILSAAKQADSSQLKLFDQNKKFVAEIDALDLLFDYLDSLIHNLAFGFEIEEYKVFYELSEKIRKLESNFDHESFVKLELLSKELLVKSFAFSGLQNKINRLISGQIDSYLCVSYKADELIKKLWPGCNENIFSSLQFYKVPNLRLVTFCGNIKDYILVEKEHETFLSNMNQKLIDMVYERYF